MPDFKLTPSVNNVDLATINHVHRAGGPADTPVLWFDASQITGLVDGNPVTTWPDASGNGRNATSSGGARPTYKTGILNGRPVVRFDGNDHLVTAAFGPVAQPNTILLVVELAAVTAGQNLFDGADFTNRQVIYTNTGPARWVVWAGSDGPNGGTTDTGPHVLSAVYNGAASTLREDGVAIGTGNVSTGAFGGLTLGAAPGGGSSYMTGDIAEVVVYDRALSVAEQDEVEGYFADKYGLDGFGVPGFASMLKWGTD